MAELIPQLKFQPIDGEGNTYPGGKLETYVAGTSTPKATYTDETGGTENTNPVILDADGRADVYMDGTLYKFILKDANDVTIWTKDNIQGAQAATLSNNIVTNAKLAQMAQSTIKGRASGAGTGDPVDLTATQVKTVLALSGADIANTPSGNLASTDVQGALNELQTDIDGKQATLAGDEVTNTILANMPAWTIKARNNAASGDPQDVALADITEESAPEAGDFILGMLADGSIRKYDVSNVGGSGGGGAGLEIYLGQSNAPLESILSNGRRTLDFAYTDEQEIFVEVKVPSSYTAGVPIELVGGRFFAALTTGNVLFQATSYLFKAGIDGTSTPTGHTSTNTQVAVSGTTNLEVAIGDIDLTDSVGEINNVAVAGGDTILAKIVRKTTSETSGLAGDARLVRASFEPKFTA